MGDLLENIVGSNLNSADQHTAEEALGNYYKRILDRIPNNADKIKYAELQLPTLYNLRQPKSNEQAKQYREEGNKYFKSGRFADALKCYNKSLCFAENNSEHVGLAYANRSAVYCELELYSRALRNIEKALEHNYPQKNIAKLKEREEKCKRKLEEGEIEPSDVPNGVEFFKLSHEPNPRLPFIADCLKLKFSEKFGRHIITEKNLMPGDVVAINEPFSKCLTSKNYQFCVNCLSDNCFDLFPCTNCTRTMFCSESCRAAAFKTFHEYECPVVDKLESSERLAVRTVLEALALFDGNIKNLKAATTHAPNETVFDFDLSGNDEQSKRISMWKAVNTLATNESLESMDVLTYFETAKITRLFLNSTKLGNHLKSKRTRDIYRELLLKLIQSSRIYSLKIIGCDLTSLECDVGCGLGFYPFVELINHSCAPNINTACFNCKTFLLVGRPIKAGEQLFVCYGGNLHCLQGRLARREKLARDFMFQCSCEACEGDYPQPANSPIVMNPDFWTRLTEDAQKLYTLNVETVQKEIGRCCAIINFLEQHYPCFENHMMTEFFAVCLQILKRSPAQINVLKQNSPTEDIRKFISRIESAKRFAVSKQP